MRVTIAWCCVALCLTSALQAQQQDSARAKARAEKKASRRETGEKERARREAQEREAMAEAARSEVNQQGAAIGTVNVSASDGGAYPLIVDQRKQGNTTMGITQVVGSTRLYQVINANHELLCSQNVKIDALGEKVCLVCDVTNHKYQQQNCAP